MPDSNFKLNIAFRDDRESDSIKNDFSFEEQTCFRAKIIAPNFAIYMELSSGRRQEKGFRECFVETAAAATPAFVLEPSVKIFFSPTN